MSKIISQNIIENVMKKYEFTGETKELLFYTLHRIRAIRDFGNVKAGYIGGWIEKEDNLSHEGNCWVGGNAIVCSDALVRENAKVLDNAIVYSDAIVRGNAQVYGYTKISGNADIYDNARVFGNANVFGNAFVHGNAQVFDNAQVYDNVELREEVKVSGYAEVCGNAKIYGDAEIKSNRDYIVFKNFWSSGRFFTWTRSNNMWTVGCFRGTGEELIKKAYADSKESGKWYEHIVKFVEVVLKEE